MCLIIDANCASMVLGTASPGALQQLRNAIFSESDSELHLVYGGHLVQEYARAGVLSVVLELDRAAKARAINERLVREKTDRIKDLCQSNDAHVIGLALASNARVLVSFDKPLQSDFKRRDLIENPRGRIYTSPKHHKLLTAHCRGKQVPKRKKGKGGR